MPHNDRFFRPSILGPAWVPSPHQVRTLDQQTSESVDGDAGGTWNPTQQIIIGGSGVAIADAGGFTGGVTTKKFASEGALILGDSDYPIHTAPKTRKILFPIRDSYHAILDIPKLPFQVWDESVPGAFKNAYRPQDFITSQIFDNRFFPAGATFSQIRLRFSVGFKPSTVPTALPSLIWSTATSSETATLATPASTAAYYNGGLPQDLILVPSVITTASASENYYFQLTQFSPGEMITFHSVAITLTNITDMRPGY